MALVITSLTDGESSASATSRNTASVSPAAGSEVIVCWSVRAADFATLASETPSISGCNGTWVQQSTTRLFGGSSQYYCVCFKGTSASWSSGAITLGTVGGTRSMDRYQWTVTQLAGQHATTPVVQIVGASGADVGANGLLSPSLAAFGDAGNFTLLVACSTGVDDPTWTIEGGYTRLSATGAVNRYSAYVGSNDTSPSVTYTADTALVEGFGLEIAPAAAAAVALDADAAWSPPVWPNDPTIVSVW